MTEQITLVFAENLRNHRQAEGLNRTELARRAGLSAGYVRLLELAARSPRIEAVEALALALEIDTAFLLTAPSKQKNARPAEAERALKSGNAG